MANPQKLYEQNNVVVLCTSGWMFEVVSDGGNCKVLASIRNRRYEITLSRTELASLGEFLLERAKRMR